MNPFPLVFAELRRQKGASIAIVALLALATMLGLAASAHERAFREATTKAAARFDLIVGAPGSGAQLVLTTVYLQPATLDLLPPDVLADLAADPRVAAVAPVAVTDSWRDHPVVGTTVAFAAPAGVAAGRAFAAIDEAVVGASVPLGLGDSVRPAHGSAAANRLESHEHDLALRVVGRAAPTGTPWDRAILVPIEAVWAMHDDAAGNGHHRGQVPAIVVKPRTVGDAYALRAAYRTPSTTAVFPAESLVPLYRILGDARDLASAFSLAFQLLLIAAVALTLAALASARRASLGALRALGAPPSFIVATVWLQGALLVVAGVALGALLAVPFLQASADLAFSHTGIEVHPRLGLSELALLAVVAGGGALLSAVPSLAMLRVPVARLLRAD